jgi:hypothetical protein
MHIKNLFKNLKQNKWLILGLIAVFCIVYADLFFGGYKVSFTNIMYVFSPFNSLDIATKGPLLSDVADQNYTVFFNYIHQFTFSSWNPQVGLGAPLSMWFYLFPLHYLFLLPLSTGIFLFSLSKFLIGFFSMYFLIRDYGGNKVGSFIAGISYTFSSILLYWHGWPHSSVAMLAPLMFLCVNKFFKTLKIKYLFWLTVIVYLALVAGMPTYTAYFLYVLGIYTLIYGFKSFYHEKRKLIFVFLGFSLSMILAILASLPYTGELLSTVGSNGYSDSRKYLSSISLDINFIRTLVFPTIRSDIGIISHANESTLYTGILAILFLPFSIMNFKKKPKMSFWSITTIILTLLIFTGLFDVIFSHLPMINTSLKTRVIVLLNFTLSVLLGLNLSDLFQNTKYYLNRKKLTFLCLALGYIVFVVASKTLVPFSGLDEEAKAEFYRIYIILLGGLLLTAILIFINSKTVKTVAMGLMCVLCIWDMGTFANDYMPFISKSASVLPQSTDTIEYLQDHSQNEEKMVALGPWTFFPSENVYYNLRDIRGHDFVYTNSDITNYYTEIQEEAFDSPTRVSFDKIDNMNLVKYLGVKYITSEQLSSLAINSFEGLDLTPSTVIAANDSFEESFIAKSNNTNHFSFLVGTYGHKYTSNETVTFTLLDSETETELGKETIAAKDIKDNDYLSIQFNNAQILKGKEYTVKITNNLPKDKPLAFYTTEKNKKGYKLFFNGEEKTGTVVMLQFNSGTFYEGKDGLFTKELDEFAPQIEIVDSIAIENSEKDILQAMSQQFTKNKLFVTKETAAAIDMETVSQNPLQTNEKITKIENQKNGNIKFDTSLSAERMVLINEYNDGNWQVLIDGKKQAVYKGNYLMRAIKVPKGNHKVELNYVPVRGKLFIIIASITGVLFVILLLFRKKLEKVAQHFYLKKKK